MMGKKDLELKLPVIDLFSCDPVATANSIRQTLESGFSHDQEEYYLYQLVLLFSMLCFGDLKESIYIGPLEDNKSYLNQWPSPEILPSWRSTMELYYEKVRDAGRRLISLIALALDLEEDFFVKDGPPGPFSSSTPLSRCPRALLHANMYHIKNELILCGRAHKIKDAIRNNGI